MWQRLPVLLGVLTYAGLFNLEYNLVGSHVFPLSPLHQVRTHPAPIGYVLLGYVMAVLPAVWMPVRLEYPSQLIYWILYLQVVIPSMFLPFRVITRFSPEEVLLLPLALWSVFVLLGSIYLIPKLKVPKPSLKPLAFKGFLLALLVLSGGVIALSQGFPRTLPSVLDPYTRRLQARSIDNTFIGYSAGIFQNGAVPSSFAYGIGTGSLTFIVIGVLTTLMSYSLTGEKSSLVLPVLLALIALVLFRFRKRLFLIATLGCSGLLLLSVAESITTGTSIIHRRLTRRLMTDAAQVTSHYWELFSNWSGPPFRRGLLRIFVGEGGPLGAAEIIGRHYFGSTASNAGANIWASAFSDLGYLGMVVVTVLIGLTMRFIDGLVDDGSSFVVGALICAAIGSVWVQSAFLTSLLSSGVLTTILVLYLLPRTHPPAPDRALRSAFKRLTLRRKVEPPAHG